ncbi:MAG: hypothetical protein ACRC30_12295 [Clostridium sp.]
MKNKKTKKKNNNKKKRIHRTELQQTTKTSDKLIYDAELGIDMNTLIEKNITIADLDILSSKDPDLKESTKESNVFIPISDFLTQDAYEKLFSKDDSLSEVACTSSEAYLNIDTAFEVDEDLEINAELPLDSNLELNTQLELDLDSKPNNSINNTVISFPIDNKTLAKRELERQKRDLNKYLQDEEKFKEFDKKLVTLTREKLPQKKQSNFSKFFNRLFV